MAWALVGTAAAVSQGAASAAVTPAWGTSQNRTANNLLICMVSGQGSQTAPTTPSGWSVASQVAVAGNCSATIFWKKAAGADAAPTIAAVTSCVWAVQLAEYSGNSNPGLDRSGTQNGVVSPSTATANGVDNGPGDLVLGCWSEFRGMTATSTYTVAFNNGATATNISNTGTSTQSHYGFSWGITTGNASADTYSVSGFSTSQLTGTSNAMATFSLPPTGAVSMSATASLLPKMPGPYLVATGTAIGTTTPQFGQPTTAGNLLVLFACATSGPSLATNPGNAWIKATTSTNGCIWYRPNCLANETPPTFPTGTQSQLAEFGGIVTTSPLDQSAIGGPGTTSPVTATAPTIDTTTQDLILFCMGNSNSAPFTSQNLVLNNATATLLVNSNTSAAQIWGYGIATSSATADSATYTFSGGTAPNATVSLASFVPSGTVTRLGAVSMSATAGLTAKIPQYSVVSQNGNNGLASPVTPTFTQPTTAGNMLVIGVTSNTTAISIGGSSAGWVLADASSASRTAIYYKLNCNASETAPTFSGGTNMGWASMEFSGGPSSGYVIDRHTSTTASATSVSTTLPATDKATGEVVFSVSQITGTGNSTSTSGSSTPSINFNSILNPSGTTVTPGFGYGITSGRDQPDMVSWGETGSTSPTAYQSLASFLLPPASGVLPISALTDAFNVAGTPDQNKWTTSGTPTPVNSGGQLTWTFPSGGGSGRTGALTSGAVGVGTDYYDLTGGQAVIQLPSVGTTTNIDFYPLWLTTAGNSGTWVRWQISGGSLSARYSNNFSQTTLTTVTYSSTTHQWLRIREQGGTTYWDYSADGLSWTNLSSVADLAGIDQVSVILQATQNASLPALVTFALENFNLPPAIRLVAQGPATSATGTVAPTFGAPTTAGNLLVALYSSNGTAFQAASCSDATWSNVGGSSPGMIWYKANCAANETAPTFTAPVGGNANVAVLLEFSGAATSSPLDQQTFSTVTGASTTATMPAADATAGELLVSSAQDGGSNVTATTSDSFNNAPVTGAGNNDTTTSTTHYRFSYGTTTANSVADADTHVAGLTNTAVKIASFKTPPTGPQTVPGAVNMSGTAGMTAVNAVVTEIAAVSLSATAGMTAVNAAVTEKATVNLSGTAGMTVSATVTEKATVSQSATASMTVSAAVTEAAAVTMSATAGLTASGPTTGPYRIFPTASGPTTATSYSGNIIEGIMFFVREAGLTFDGYWWWVCSSGGQSTSPSKFCLWEVATDDGGQGAVVPNSTVTSGTLSTGWNYVPLPKSIELAPGVFYKGCVGLNGPFPFTQPYWVTPGPDVVNGPLVVPTYTTNNVNWFDTSTADPTTVNPTTTNTAYNAWIDVQVSRQKQWPQPYQIWPKYAAPHADYIPGSGVDTTAWTLANQFSLAKTCTLYRLWWYSAPTAALLPSRCGVWNATSQTVVPGSDNTSPTWRKPDGTTASAGAGWVYCDYGNAGVTLTAGNYKPAVYSGGGSNWYMNGALGNTTAYFNPGQGMSGLDQYGFTKGPLTLPPAASVSGGQGSAHSTTWGYPAADGTGTNFWIDIDVVDTTTLPLRGYPSNIELGNGTGAPVAADGSTVGQGFQVTKNTHLQGYWIWCASSTSQPTTPMVVTLWQETGNSTATWLGSSVTATSGTLGRGQWNWVPLNTPYALTANTPYRVVAKFPGNLAQNSSDFAAGGSFDGLANGCLQFFSETGGVRPDPNGTAGTTYFNAANTDPTVNYPASSDGGYNWSLDVQVDAQPGDHIALWSEFMGRNGVSVGGPGGAGAFQPALHFSLLESCALAKIWWYSGSGASILPSRCGVWDDQTQTVVAGTDNTSPAWKNPDGTTASAGAGWVYCDYTSAAVSLNADHLYAAAVYGSSGSNWVTNGGTTFGSGGDQQNGALIGPLSIPGNAYVATTQQSYAASWVYPSTTTGNGDNWWMSVEVAIPVPAALGPSTPSLSGVLGAPYKFFVLGAPPVIPSAPVVAGAVAMSGTAGLTVAGVVTEIASVTESATAGLTVAAKVTQVASVTEAATAGMTIGATVTQVASVTESATAGLTVTAKVTEVASITMSGTAGLTASATVTEVASVNMSGTAGMTVTAAPITTTGTVVMSGTAGLTTTASVTQVATVTEVAGSSLTVAASVTEVASVTMSGSAGMTVTGVQVQFGSVSMSSTAGMTVTGALAITGTVTETATAGLTLTASVTEVATVSESANSSLTVAASVIEVASVSMSGSAGMTVTAAVATVAGSVSMSATAGMTATASIATVAGSVSESATAGMTVTASVTQVATVTESATASLVLATSVIEVASVSMSATASQTVTGLIIVPGSVTLGATAGLTVGAVVTVIATVSMTDTTSNLAVATSGTQLGTVTMAATAGATISALVTEVASVALAASAALNVSATLAITSSVVETASAGLTVAAAVTQVASVAMSGTGSLTVTGIQVQFATVSMSGDSSLTVSATVTQVASVVMSATASQSVTGTWVQLASIAMSATAGATISAAVTQVASVAMSGDTNLAIATSGTQLGSVVMSGTAGLTVVGTLVQLATVSLAGSATLSITAIVIETASVTFGASAGMTLTASVVQVASIALSAGTTLTVVASAAGTTSINMAANSGLTVTAAPMTVGGAVALSASAALTLVAAVIEVASVAMSAGASLTAAGTITWLASVTMSASAGMTVTGLAISAQGVSMSASTGMTVTATATYFASVALSAGAALAISATVIEIASVAMSGTAGLVTTGTRVQFASISLVGNAGMVVTGALAPAGVNMAAGTGMTVVATATYFGQVAMSATSGLTTSLTVTQFGSVLLSGTSSLTVTGTRVQFASVSMAGDTSLVASATVTIFARVDMTAGAGLNIIPLGTAAASVAMSATTALTAGGVVAQEAAVTMTAAAALLITGLAVAAEVVPVTLNVAVQTMRLVLQVVEQTAQLSVADQTVAVTTQEQIVQAGLRTMVVTATTTEVIDPVVAGY